MPQAFFKVKTRVKRRRRIRPRLLFGVVSLSIGIGLLLVQLFKLLR